MESIQKTHYNTTFKQAKFPIVLLCDNINKAPNIGSLFRTSDAFGIEKLIFCGQNIPLGKRMTKTSRSTEKVVRYEIHENALEIVNDLKSKGYYIVSLEITSESIPIHQGKFINKPMVLIIGDENHGISKSVLNLSDAVIHINMFGYNTSMNVVQATAVALYEITKQMDT